MNKWRHDEEGMTLVEVIAAMTIILIVMVASTAAFLEIRKVQDATNLRSQAHDLVTTTLVDYEDYAFDRIGIARSLKDAPVASGGLGGATTYKPPADDGNPNPVAEPIKYDTSYASSLIQHKTKKLIGPKQYDVTTYVTTPATVSGVDYQPVRVTLEVNLGGAAGVVKDSKVIFPQAGSCPVKRLSDVNVSSYEGCK